MEVQEFRLEELKDAIKSSRRRNDIEEEFWRPEVDNGPETQLRVVRNAGQIVIKIL